MPRFRLGEQTSVVFEFCGGPHDGLVVRSTVNEMHDDHADDLLWQTDGGKPGTEFSLPTDYARERLQADGTDGVELTAPPGRRFPEHIYEVFVRRFGRAVITIRARHLRAEV